MSKLLQILQGQNFDKIKELLETDEYRLVVKQDESKYMITYYRRMSNMDNDIVNECRGIIVEKETNRILCYTFNSNDKLSNEEVIKILE